MTKQNINTNINQDYKYGFITDIENIRAPKGLSEQSIKFISDIGDLEKMSCGCSVQYE